MPRKGEIKNRADIRYGRLIAIKFTGVDQNNRTLWLCKCDCGNEIVVRGNDLQNGDSKSCGCFRQEISSKAMNKIIDKQIGEKHPHYTNGATCGKNTKAIHELKEKIRKRDNYTCQECEIIQEKYEKVYNRKLDVHHIDRDDTNNIEENMITLCHSCHNKIKLQRKMK